MPATPAFGGSLTLEVEVTPDVTVLCLGGELDGERGFELASRLEVQDPGRVQLVVDLTDLMSLQASGIGPLLAIRHRARRLGMPLGIVCPDIPMQRLFWAAGARPQFVMGDTVDDVRSALAERGCLRTEPGTEG
jgi:anti-anti-sigma factor